MPMTVDELLGDALLNLSVAAGRVGLCRPITTAELNRPSLELTGYFDAFRAERIQVVGKGEVTYMEAHEDDPACRRNLTRILAPPTPCVIVTNDRQPPRLMVEEAETIGTPILRCPHHTTKLFKRLWDHLDSEFAPETTIHGVLLDVHDLGVLLQGDSAIGKSECGLELVRRGFHLVADDMVVVKCLSDSVLVGHAADLMPYHMEARGLGIIDVSRLFGVAAIRREKRISLAITLVAWDQAEQYDRTGLEDKTLTILDVDVPHVVIPLSPGRNVGTLVEVAALNQKLKSLGIHTAKLIEDKLLETLQGQRSRFP